jgi:hypothetical protein
MMVKYRQRRRREHRVTPVRRLAVVVPFIAAVAVSRADVIAYLVNVTTEASSDVANVDDALRVGQDVGDEAIQSRALSLIATDVKTDFSTADEYQAFCPVSQAVNQLSPHNALEATTFVCSLLAAGTAGTMRGAMMRHPQRAGLSALMITCGVAAVAALGAPAARADNKRLNDSVWANVYTIQHQAGCTTNIKRNPQLQLAAQWHTHDVLTDRSLDGDIGSDDSTPQSRAAAAGFRGTVAETVAINPAMAINGIDILNQWYYNPASFAIMSDCANTAIGVWSENGLDRTVVVAVYGQPE